VNHDTRPSLRHGSAQPGRVISVVQTATVGSADRHASVGDGREQQDRRRECTDQRGLTFVRIVLPSLIGMVVDRPGRRAFKGARYSSLGHTPTCTVLAWRSCGQALPVGVMRCLRSSREVRRLSVPDAGWRLVRPATCMCTPGGDKKGGKQARQQRVRGSQAARNDAITGITRAANRNPGTLGDVAVGATSLLDIALLGSGGYSAGDLSSSHRLSKLSGGMMDRLEQGPQSRSMAEQYSRSLPHTFLLACSAPHQTYHSAYTLRSNHGIPVGTSY
jgi:hypothetical protein